MYANAPEPTYTEAGELEDGGTDLNMGGLCTYYHDLIYLSAFVQIMAIFTDRAWLCFGVVRARAFVPKHLRDIVPGRVAWIHQAMPQSEHTSTQAVLPGRCRPMPPTRCGAM